MKAYKSLLPGQSLESPGVRSKARVGILHPRGAASTLGFVRNLKLTIAYDGTEYHGWQFQPGLRTVEGRLVEVLSPITQTRVGLVVAGRTDAGVHARGQVASFRTESAIDLDRLRRAANSRLESGIVIRRIEEVAERFNARFDARGKHYRYALWADREKPPVTETRYLRHWYRPLEVEVMAAAARHLVGTHDFKSFETTSSQPRKSTICRVRRLDVRRRDEHVWIDVEGDRFLYNMIRNIVGTLLEVGRGHWSADRLVRILEARDRAAAGPMAPARGLTMMQVFYDESAPAPSEGRA